MNRDVSRETAVAVGREHRADGRVSRETSSAVTRRRHGLLAAAAAATIALAAAACAAPPGPQGWAPARTVRVDSQQTVLVAYKAKLFALPNASSNATWQFPPKDKSQSPPSDAALDDLRQAAASAVSDADAIGRIEARINDLRLSGPSKDALKSEIDASAPADRRGKLKSLVDDTLSKENDALKDLKAIYGDIGVAADGQTAYVGTFRGIVFALDTRDGHMRWWRDAGDGLIGGIAVDGSTLYFGTKGHDIFAWDADTGEQRWRVGADGEVWATPTVAADTVYATSLDGSVHALDKATGARRWRFSGAGSGIGSKAVVDGDAVYVGAFDNKLYALSADTGQMKWSFKAGNWFWATPLVRDDVVYAASLDGSVYAIDAGDGTQRWERALGSGVRSAPVFAGGGLMVASRDGRVWKLDPGSGEPSPGSPAVTGETVLADLTADGNEVYVVPEARLFYVFDASREITLPGSVPLPQ